MAAITGMLGGTLDLSEAQAAEPGAPEDYPLTVVMALGDGSPIAETHDELFTLGRQQIQGMTDYWAAQSNGMVQPSVASFEWADADQDGQPDTITCRDRRTSINAGMAQTGFIPGDQRKFVFLVPAGCPTGGKGWATSTWMYVEQEGSARQGNGALAHEFGHTLDFQHAQALTCSDGEVDGELKETGGTCTVTEYGDDTDVMGSSGPAAYGDFSTPNAIASGFITSPDFIDIAEVTDQTVVLQNRGLLKGLRAARVTDPIDGRQYYVEYAQESPYSQNYWLAGGIFEADGARYRTDWGLRVLKLSDDHATQALAAPTGADGIRNLYWMPGEEFVSPSGGIRVEVVAQGTTTATVRLRTSNDVTPPAAPSQIASDGSLVRGLAEPGAVISIVDAVGGVIGTSVADSAGAFTTMLIPAQVDGTVLAVSAADAAGLKSPDATVTVERPLDASFSSTETAAGETQVITGTGFLPDELVTATASSTSEPFAQARADSAGVVTFTLSLSRAAPVGTVEITLTAASGSIVSTFQIAELAAPDPAPQTTGLPTVPPDSTTAGSKAKNIAEGRDAGSATPEQQLRPSALAPALAMTGGEVAPLLWTLGGVLAVGGATLTFTRRRA